VIGTMAAPTLVLDPKGNGLTRWEDCRPGRTDLPRHLAEIPVLGITPLRAGDEVTMPGWCFRRTRRPGQGRLTGRPTLGLLLVLISPRTPNDPEAAQSLRDWADFIHISHIAAAGVPGYTMITPYEVDGAGPRFLHFYEMDDGDDPEATFKRMTPLVHQRLNQTDYDRWTGHPELRIDYVSTYRLIRD
jgi:hypothetical protein